MRGLAGVVPGNHRPLADILEVAGIGNHQHRAPAVDDHLHDEVLGQQRVAAMLALAEDDQIGMAGQVGDLAQHFGIAAAIDVDPFGAGQAGRGLGEGRLAGIARRDILRAGPGGDDTDALRGCALAEDADQPGIVLPGEADREFKAKAGALAGIEVDHQVLQRHGVQLRSIAWEDKRRDQAGGASGFKYRARIASPVCDTSNLNVRRRGRRGWRVTGADSWRA
jgi:hypothetical protein